MPRRGNGFTLIELAVVLLIIAIAVTLVFPRFGSGIVERARLRSSANRIASVAEYAHQRAACARLTHLLHLDTANGTYWITGQTTDGQTASITDDFGLKGRLGESVRFAGVELRDMDANSDDILTIRFSPQGWADPATVQLISSTGETLSVIIDELSGQVQTCRLEEMN